MKSDEEIAIESNQTLLYETLKHDNPRLYKELQEEIMRIKHKVKGGTAMMENNNGMSCRCRLVQSLMYKRNYSAEVLRRLCRLKTGRYTEQSSGLANSI